MLATYAPTYLLNLDTCIVWGYIKYILPIIYILNRKNVNYVANIQIYLILIRLKLIS